MDRDDQRPLVEYCEDADKSEVIKNFDPLCEKSREMAKVVKEVYGLDKIIAVEVDHCPQSYACLLVGSSFGPGGKIIYSGDTRPCQNFINYAKGCTVMIHEATLGKGLEEEAAKKKHTTTLEAIELVSKVKPWRTILTHFSCRYMKLAEILPEH